MIHAQCRVAGRLLSITPSLKQTFERQVSGEADLQHECEERVRTYRSSFLRSRGSCGQYLPIVISRLHPKLAARDRPLDRLTATQVLECRPATKFLDCSGHGSLRMLTMT